VEQQRQMILKNVEKEKDFFSPKFLLLKLTAFLLCAGVYRTSTADFFYCLCPDVARIPKDNRRKIR